MATVLGSRPILNVDADPNTIPGLEIQSELESQFAIDLSTGKVYKYDANLTEGERWVIYDPRPYKVYVGIIIPLEALVTLENDTGVTFTYESTSNSILASSPIFLADKTFVLATSNSNANGNTTVSAGISTANVIQLKWVMTTGFGSEIGYADSDTYIEIRIYP